MVLYWMVAYRRPGWNWALEHAVARAQALDRPLVVLEALRCDYRYASDRLHRFVIQGMAAQAEAFARAGVTYIPYVEPEVGAGRGLLRALASHACVVVSDDWPCFFVPRMLAAAGRQLPVALELIDGNGLLPLSAAAQQLHRAVDFRRLLQRALPRHLAERAQARPLAVLPRRAWTVPREIRQRWPAARLRDLLRPRGLAALPIDHEVPPALQPGGWRAGAAQLRRFLRDGLGRYDAGRRAFEDRATSGLSPYLHFGHVGAQQVVEAVLHAQDWTIDRLSARVTGQRTGWWGVDADAEAFLDQVVTWRELAFHTCHHQPGCDRWPTLPAWARRTLTARAGDPRPALLSRQALEAARTPDPVWNAAQEELRRTGTLHGYLRMQWGKSVLAWTADPRQALARLFYLNDRWALDGRDPNSIAGITWVFGRYDHPWPPERPILGTVRPMVSARTARKIGLPLPAAPAAAEPRQRARAPSR